jgi:hypothetical protein
VGDDRNVNQLLLLTYHPSTVPNLDVRLSSVEWQRLRKLILQRDNFVCQIHSHYCLGLATQVDHIDPPLEGGSFWDPTNLRAACKPCNARRGGQLRARRQDIAAAFCYRQPVVPMDTRL